MWEWHLTLLPSGTTEHSAGMRELLSVTCGCWQNGQLGVSCSREGLPLQRGDFITDRLRMNPGKERCGGHVETGLTPFFSHLSQLILKLAMYCFRSAEVVSWCECAHTLVPPCVRTFSWGHLGSREGRKPQNGGLTECTSAATGLGLCCVLPRFEG